MKLLMQNETPESISLNDVELLQYFEYDSQNGKVQAMSCTFHSERITV
jgi:hypothetical protein